MIVTSHLIVSADGSVRVVKRRPDYRFAGAWVFRVDVTIPKRPLIEGTISLELPDVPRRVDVEQVRVPESVEEADDA